MIHLSQPWLLLLWPLAFVLWCLPPIKRLMPNTMKVPFFAGLYNTINQYRIATKPLSTMLMWGLIWTLLVLAVAGPRWVGDAWPLSRDGRNLMLAMDLSGSMEIDDMRVNNRPVSRLAVVKTAAEQFVKKRSGDKVGLILFGSQAYLQTPLTYDRQTVLAQLKDASIGLAGKTTAIGDAIGLSVKRLKDTPHKGRVLILLTDGANNAGILQPLNAAKMAKKEAVKIYTIGLGSTVSQSRNRFFYSVNPAADLDEKTLKSIADITGGKYFRATNPKALQRIYDTINSIETVQQDHAEVRPQIEYYPWLLGAALILLGLMLIKNVTLWPTRNTAVANTEGTHD